MKKTFWKNLFQSLSAFGVLMVFEFIFLGMLLMSPPFKVGIILVLSMVGAMLVFFATGFYWIFQIVVIDESGICIRLFSKIIRTISWGEVESIENSNRFRNPELKINVKGERPLYLDRRKTIRNLADFYVSQNRG